MKSGLYMRPGEPATCSAAVRAIWLARPGTSVSKVSAGLSRLREGSAAAAAWAAQRRIEVDRPAACGRYAVAGASAAVALRESDVEADRLAGELAENGLD